MSTLHVGLFMIGAGWAAWCYTGLVLCVWRGGTRVQLALWSLGGACAFWFALSMALTA